MAGVKLTPEQFDQLAGRLERASGLAFDTSRREALALAVAERMAAVGDEVVADYLARLCTTGEVQLLVEELTVPETQFLRNPPQMAALRDQLLPALTATAAREGRALRIWSAGCATGEEAYSLALLARPLALSAAVPAQIVATDISGRALAAARAGRYAERAVALMSPTERERCFLPRETAKDPYEVRPELREAVEFRGHNLVADPPPFPAGQADLILCRNVTIYFSRDTTAKLARRFHAALRPGGFLLLGHAETLWQICEDFELARLGDAFVYQRAEAAAGRPEPRRPRRVSRPAPGRTGVAARPKLHATAAAPGREPAAAPAPAADEEVRRAVRAGDHARAVERAARLAEAHPLQPEHHYLHGLALANLGRDFEAVVSLRRAVYLDPGHGLANFLLGGALERLGESRAAARCYRAAAMLLAADPPQRPVAELGGRRTAELVQLCLTSAVRAEAAGGAGPQTGQLDPLAGGAAAAGGVNPCS
jgi:chemotaxis protein methyltransferase CheR